MVAKGNALDGGQGTGDRSQGSEVGGRGSGVGGRGSEGGSGNSGVRGQVSATGGHGFTRMEIWISSLYPKTIYPCPSVSIRGSERRG